MKSMLKLLAIAPLAVLIGLVGCGDDENPVETVTVFDTVRVVDPGPPMYIFGAVYLHDSVLNGYVELFDRSASGVRPDSVVVGSNVISDLNSWYWTPDDNYYAAPFWRLNDSSFVSGDTVPVKIYYGSEMAMVSHKVMDRRIDTLIMIDEPESPITPGSDLVLTWNTFEDADFYGVSVSFEENLGEGMYSYTSEQLAITDTTITIPGSSLDYVGSFSYQIYPYRGPIPTAEGVMVPNINTPSMTGHFWTYGGDSYRWLSVSDVTRTSTDDSGEKNRLEPKDLLRRLMDK